MAVKSEKIKERLKLKHPKLNLSKTRLDAFADKLKEKPQDDATDEQIDEIISDYLDILPIEDVAKLEDQNRSYKSRLEAAEKGKSGAGTPDDEEEEEESDDPVAKAIAKALKPLTTSVSELTKNLTDFKNEKAAETKTQEVTRKFKEHEVIKHLPEKMQTKLLKLIDISEDADIDAQVSEIGEEYKEFVQTQADSQEYATAPQQSLKPGKFSEEEANRIANAVAGTTDEEK